MVKNNIIISRLGHIAQFSAGHLGISSDKRILENTMVNPLYILPPNSYIGGDGAYTSIGYCLGPYKKPRNAPLSIPHRVFNYEFSRRRCLVERTISRITRHGQLNMKKNRTRDLEWLAAMLRVTACWEQLNIIMHLEMKQDQQ